MKKLIYLCGMMLITMNMMAQEKSQMEHDTSRYCHDKHYKHLNVDYDASITDLTPGWRYDSVLSDEFHGTTIDTTKWEIANKEYHPHFTTVGYMNHPDNVCLLNDSLVMSITDNNNNQWCSLFWNDNDSILPDLLSGWLSSKKTFRYGYIETECYLPRNHHYWPCLWTTGRDLAIDDYDEVDVFERTSDELTDYPYIIRQNCYNGSGTSHQSFLSSILSFSENDSITGKSSVFGAEILPGEVVFYINGRVTNHVKFHDGWENDWNTYTCTDIEEMIRTKIKLTLTCPKTQTTVPLPQETTLFKYFRCYKLERGDADTYHPLVFNPSEESSKVYPHVVLGGAGYEANISSKAAIWAEQDIILGAGFELSANTPFSARVISVPNPTHSDLYKQYCHY